MTLTNEASQATRRTVTNTSGFFAFAALPAGTYTLTVTMPGFKTYEVTGIELRAATAARCARSRSRSRPWPRPSR